MKKVKQFIPEDSLSHQQIIQSSVNPLPSLSEPVEQHAHINMSNYNYHQQNTREKFSQPHERKKANFEHDRRSNISNVSNNIIPSRERLHRNDSASSSGVNHSMNTNKGYVKMTPAPAFGTQSVPQELYSHHSEANYQQPAQRIQDVRQKVPENGQNKAKKKKRGDSESILNQYSHNLPPTQIEYQSGIGEIPPPIYDPGQDTLRKKVQAKPLPGNGDLKELEDCFDEIRNGNDISENNKENFGYNKEPGYAYQNQKDTSKRKSTYKPYSLKEYKEKPNDPKFYRMGGLGANIGTEEWEKKNSKLQAMRQFASKVKITNKATNSNPPKRKKEPTKEKSKREKALEFAKNVPKPKIPPKKQKIVKQKTDLDRFEDELMGGLDDIPEEPKYSELDELNQKHEHFVNEVNDIKKLFM